MQPSIGSLKFDLNHGIYILVYTYWYIHTGIHILVYTYWYIHTGIYILIVYACMHTSTYLNDFLVAFSYFV